jgi:DNA mismatch endonuclease (patch repair protein)
MTSKTVSATNAFDSSLVNFRMTDHLDKTQRSWNMSRIRGKDTKPEIAVRQLLHA